MPVVRQFLDPNRAALPQAVDLLAARYAAGGEFDLSKVVVVVPGARAGRRLVELFAARAETDGAALTPPHVCTPRTLPELLYPLQRPLASDVVQRLAWVHALRSADARELAAVVRHPPAAGETIRWLGLADVVRRTHAELAANALHFGHVAETLAAQRAPRAEVQRWQALRTIQQAYLTTLDGLHLWDQQTARLVALAQSECRTDRDLVLVGTADLEGVMRQMLRQVADRVTALVHAPDDWADRFDELGCVQPAAWAEASIELADEQILLADGPLDQAAAVLGELAALGGARRAEEIVVGVPDESLVPQLERQLSQCGVPCRYGPGRPIAETAPYRLLAALADFLERGSFRELAALVRHADVQDWLAQRGAGGYLAQLDKYQADHLPPRLGDEWLGEAQRYERLRKMVECLAQWTARLRGGARPLADWSPPIAEMLLDLYGDRELSAADPADRLLLESCRKLHAVLLEHQAETPDALAIRVTAAEAIRLALGAASAERIPPPGEEEAVELLGWLELPLDDAPVLVVTSVNEGIVPSSTGADLFLPDGLRRRLDLLDNQRRYARDAYALSIVLSSRERVRLVVGRRNRDGDPLAPSRLLLATDRETMARRALRFFGERHAEVRSPQAGQLQATRATSAFDYLRPRPDARIEGLSVTAFRAYLACPYRFYLAYVLRLEAANDAAKELDGRGFGNLIHDVLREFAASDCRDATDADKIARTLDELLDAQVRRQLGDHPLPAVAVQVEQARLRLKVFAQRQAARAAEGWQIVHSEWSPEGPGVKFPVDGKPFFLRGRVDRIDHHPASGRWAILDYKTGEDAQPPDKTHRKGRRGSEKQWIDLQLPLYRHLVTPLKLDGAVELGYALLPKDASKTEFAMAAWETADLEEADDVARDVIRSIRQGVFWPPADPPPEFSEDWAWLCMEKVLDRPPFDPPAGEEDAR